MPEKLLLAVILTFALTLFTERGWSSPAQLSGSMNLQHKEVLALTQLHR